MLSEESFWTSWGWSQPHLPSPTLVWSVRGRGGTVSQLHTLPKLAFTYVLCVSEVGGVYEVADQCGWPRGHSPAR